MITVSTLLDKKEAPSKAKSVHSNLHPCDSSHTHGVRCDCLWNQEEQSMRAHTRVHSLVFEKDLAR